MENFIFCAVIEINVIFLLLGSNEYCKCKKKEDLSVNNKDFSCS